MLQELAGQKRIHQLLIAAGCLTQRYGAEFVRRVPGINGLLGTRRWMDIMDVVTKLLARKFPQPLYHLPTEVTTVGTDEQNTLRASV